MTNIAYVQGSSTEPGSGLPVGCLVHGGTLTIDDTTHDIPPNTLRGDRPANVRVSEVLEKVGYRLADEWVYATDIPNEDGVFAVRVVAA